jgi:hypothetical protein
MQQKHEFTGGFVMKVVGKFCYLLVIVSVMISLHCAIG